MQILATTPSAWSGHFDFSQWIIKEKSPEVIVELGVDYGFSSLAFTMPDVGHVYSIDCFAGMHEISQPEAYTRNLIQTFDIKNITLIKDYFDNVAREWNKPIDILHIDGDHAYESVKKDFETWSKFVKDDGVILMHDTCVEYFGVKDFFAEINLPKTNFPQSSGLGVVSKNVELIEKVKRTFNLE